MKKTITLFSVAIILFSLTAEAQYYGKVRMRPRRPAPRTYSRPPVQRQPQQKSPVFEPTLNFSAGFGFPNLDKDKFSQFMGTTMGNVSQTGPFTGAVDYQFSPYMSIGALGTYGKVSVPYYAAPGNLVPAFNGRLENWSIMLNVMTYAPTYNRKVEPYLRTAIGINNWKQEYTDASGNKVANVSTPDELAYQASLGARFNLSKGAGIYLEGGYGKYIFNGGLTLKF